VETFSHLHSGEAGPTRRFCPDLLNPLNRLTNLLPESGVDKLALAPIVLADHKGIAYRLGRLGNGAGHEIANGWNDEPPVRWVAKPRIRRPGGTHLDDYRSESCSGQSPMLVTRTSASVLRHRP
jgi:hypothetical protein